MAQEKNLEKPLLWREHPHHLTRKSDTQGTESGEERLSNPNDPRNFKIYVWCGDMVNCGEQTICDFRIKKEMPTRILEQVGGIKIAMPDGKTSVQIGPKTMVYKYFVMYLDCKEKR